MAHDLMELFDEVAGTVRAVLGELVSADEVEALAVEVRTIFSRLSEEFPYKDRPDHVMFAPSFNVFVYLAIYQAVRILGIGVHRVGRAIHAVPLIEIAAAAENMAALPQNSADSMRDAAPNEFIFELVPAKGDESGGIDIHACAVCHIYGKYDAMELVPYMCATDDIVSDEQGQGLRRTGTIGLGASRCDFRYTGNDPLPLVDQYPEKIQLQKPT